MITREAEQKSEGIVQEFINDLISETEKLGKLSEAFRIFEIIYTTASEKAGEKNLRLNFMEQCLLPYLDFFSSDLSEKKQDSPLKNLQKSLHEKIEYLKQQKIETISNKLFFIPSFRKPYHLKEEISIHSLNANQLAESLDNVLVEINKTSSSLLKEYLARQLAEKHEQKLDLTNFDNIAKNKLEFKLRKFEQLTYKTPIIFSDYLIKCMAIFKSSKQANKDTAENLALAIFDGRHITNPRELGSYDGKLGLKMKGFLTAIAEEYLLYKYDLKKQEVQVRTKAVRFR